MSPEQDASAEGFPELDATAPWVEALAQMERELQGALARIEPVPWRPPIALGPIPPELHDRATRLLEAQLHTIRYLEDVRQTTGKHIAALKSVPRTEQGPRPVYFDLLG
ncbi:hypothetical protein ACFVU2_04945 [Leifsonia sp. NPDC058194]|uniref:hypothetical protein n=1 Tax=Leifsonia sp. NPDC058194 TaxID=3346374 RepID=UPI0036DB0888